MCLLTLHVFFVTEIVTSLTNNYVSVINCTYLDLSDYFIEATPLLTDDNIRLILKISASAWKAVYVETRLKSMFILDCVWF